ncbi:hypothetical protein EVJ58_g7138 [Rhodofomes roseus]|uniref:Uncharacterized protein n=1 Tax=Rhodofomes roseus TaxID=34475 RepID=A0A4Y9Y440_9APHY|nr:hypothetical protein EVJ58_g7138 [Rhodofomes roseus]
MDTIPLPIGPCPGWELESHSDTEASDEEPQELRNIPESLVVSQSLRQSRTIWLSSAFPKFSAKARGGKPPEVVPPPHSIKVYGRYDVRIGPHIFSDTTFYEVCYLPEGPAALSALTESSDTHKDSPDTSVTVTPDLVSQAYATSTLPHHPWSYAGSSPYNTVASSVATSGAPTASAAKDPTGPKTTTEIVPVVIRAENATPQAGPSTNTDHDVEMHT